MILIIDNYDSFTYNLYQQIEKLGTKTKIIKNDELKLYEIKRLKPKKIIISPGPGRPEETGISESIVRFFYTTTPILGICLGHQLIGQIFGSKVVHAKNIMHGKTSKITHDEKTIFNKVKQGIEVARYHSLILKNTPKEFETIAQTKEKEIMAIKSKKYKLFGVQFHPESFLTKEGDKIMKNFINI